MDDGIELAGIHACYEEVLHLLDQIPSVSDEEKKRKYFETIPPLVSRQFTSSRFNIFHFAAANQSPNILKVFDLEKKLYPEDETSRIMLLPDSYGNHPFIYALINYDRGPDFQLAQRLIYSSSLGGNFEPQLYLQGTVEHILEKKNFMLRKNLSIGSKWEIWDKGLEMFKSAHILLLSQFAESIAGLAGYLGELSSYSSAMDVSLSSLHQLPLPYLSLVLLGLRLKNSLRHQSIRQAFDGQEAAVDHHLEFLETYLQLSPNISLGSLKNDGGESIFEFCERMYFMQVGDPLQLMRHFAFFLSWTNPPEALASKLLASVACNPLLNPIERLNYVILLAASTAQHPLHNSKDGNLLSIRDAISTIESSAAQLSSGSAEEHDDVLSEDNNDVGLDLGEQPPAIADNPHIAEAETESVGDLVRDETIPSTTTGQDSEENPKEDDDVEPADEFSFLPAFTLLNIGNTLCNEPPSLKYLSRRRVRSLLDFSMLLYSEENDGSTLKLPKFILDYLRMKEYRNVRIRLLPKHEALPNSGIPHLETEPTEYLISFEKVLHLQLPVILHC